MEFKKAVRKQVKARVAIAGPAGAGKTYTALIAATVLANGGKIAMIDTERQSARLYADEFDFDVLELETFEPGLYEQAIQTAEGAGYSVIVIDSLSHAWEGVGGTLDQKGRLQDQRGYNSWTAWRKITPIHNSLVDTMLRCNCHVIATLRSKMEYEQVKDENGKSTVEKIGLAPIQRQGVEYEFTLFCDMEVNHSIVVSKTRSKPMTDVTANLPDATFWKPFADWLDSGEEYVPNQSPEQDKADRYGHPLKKQGGGGNPEEDQPEANNHFHEPEALRGKLREFAIRYSDQDGDAPTTKEQQQMIAACLDKLCLDTKRRRTFTSDVFGWESSADMKLCEFHTLNKWMRVPAVGAFEPDPDSLDILKDEANRLVNGVINAETVGELPGMEDDASPAQTTPKGDTSG